LKCFGWIRPQQMKMRGWGDSHIEIMISMQCCMHQPRFIPAKERECQDSLVCPVRKVQLSLSVKTLGKTETIKSPFSESARRLLPRHPLPGLRHSMQWAKLRKSIFRGRWATSSSGIGDRLIQ
jgi:hypothetical protein